jgi:hypothetical protein
MQLRRRAGPGHPHRHFSRQLFELNEDGNYYIETNELMANDLSQVDFGIFGAVTLIATNEGPEARSASGGRITNPLAHVPSLSKAGSPVLLHRFVKIVTPRQIVAH